MKLRNKKTGEIREFDSIGFRKGKSNGWDDFIPNADSLAEFNKEWEDYKPDEPLIKDEKIRKVVRAWAECCHVQVVNHYFCDCNSCFMFTDEGGNDCSLDFTFRIDNLESDVDYTIAELCGEEEE